MNEMINSSRSSLMLVALAVSLGIGCPARAEEMVQWQSNNRTPTQLSSELNTLYGGLVELLEQGQRVATEPFKDVNGQQVVRIARDKGLYHGTYFPPNLNAYLCLLNTKLCDVSQSGLGNATYNWHNKAGDLIVLPKVKLEAVIVPKPYQKKENDTIMSIVVDDREGCETLDARCEKYLQALNRTREGFMEPDYEGMILVPTATYRADIEFERAVPMKTGGVALPTEAGLTGDNTWLNLFEQQQLPAARLVPNNVDAAPSVAFGDRATIRSLVNFPENGELRGNSTVAVFDRQVFIDHCDFHSRIEFVPVDDTGSAVIFEREDKVKKGGNGASPPECNSPIHGGGKRGRDHGTHVVGIIGARTLGIDNTQNVLRRKVFAFQLPERQHTPSSQVVSRLAKTITESLPDADPRVMNMSSSYEFEASAISGFDPIAQFIRTLENEDFLFVAAAGNAAEGQPGERFQGNCDIRPACIEAENIISVVALDLDHDAPSVLPASNRGEVFDIAAPGANIESTTFSHTKGAMTGTSQAVPLVSIAASLLMSKRSMNARQARHRLMYTSELFPYLEKDVFSGRLDVSAALDLEKAKIIHTSPSLPETLSGQLLTGNHRKINFLDFDSDETFLVHPRDIRRLQSYHDEDYALLFYVDGRTGRDLMRRRVLLDKNDGKLQFKIETPASLQNRVREVPVASIADYIASF